MEFDNWGNPIPMNPAQQRRQNCWNMAKQCFPYDKPTPVAEVLAAAVEIERFIYGEVANV